MSDSSLLRHHCMVVHNYYPIGEPRVQRQADALASARLRVDVICLRDRDEPADEVLGNGVRVFRMSVRRDKRRGPLAQLLEYLAFFGLAFVHLTRLYLRHRYQVVEIHNLPDFLVFVGLAPRRGGAALILNLHDLMPEFYRSRFGGDENLWIVRLVRWQERVSCSFADHVITVSQHWREALIQRGVPAQKVSVVMNVADDRIFALNNNRPQTVSSSEFRLIYHGAIVYRYGLDLIVQAMNQVRHVIPNIRLTILGRGAFVPTLVEMTRHLGLTEHVIIQDRLRPIEEMPDIIRSAHVGVVAYRNDIFTDGLLPTKLMEYAASGLPCIASRTMAIHAYFKDTMVEFFTPGDADDLARCILSLYNHPERLAELAQGCVKFNQRYNWARVGAEYVALVKHVSQRQTSVLAT